MLEEQMIQVRETDVLEIDVTTLEQRLQRGADLLFLMEQQGDTGIDYQRWLSGYTDLLRQYEILRAA
jgi:hypothetical protein